MAEKEYIERGILFDNLNKAWGTEIDGVTCNRFMEIVNSVPAADVRPVVLCRDCQHCRSDRAGNIVCYNYVHYGEWGKTIKLDDYCSLGKKRGKS